MNRIERSTIALTALFALVLLAGCSSDGGPGSPLAPPNTEPDTAPPAVPTGLAVAGDQIQVKLAWDANVTDADLAGYRVYRLAFGRYLPLVEAPVADNRWVDRNPMQSPCFYAVTAVDAAGNESAWQSVGYSPASNDTDLESAP